MAFYPRGGWRLCSSPPARASARDRGGRGSAADAAQGRSEAQDRPARAEGHGAGAARAGTRSRCGLGLRRAGCDGERSAAGDWAARLCAAWAGLFPPVRRTRKGAPPRRGLVYLWSFMRSAGWPLGCALAARLAAARDPGQQTGPGAKPYGAWAGWKAGLNENLSLDGMLADGAFEADALTHGRASLLPECARVIGGVCCGWRGWLRLLP